MMRMTAELTSAIDHATLDEIQAADRHDAIVVGGGAAGGLAAALLAEKGLRVLVLDAGWKRPFWQVPFRRAMSTALKSLDISKTMRVLPPNFVYKGERVIQILGKVRQPVQSTCYAWATAPELFVDDLECSYETPAEAPFRWIRARGLGGRVAVPAHGRQYLRHGPRDFQPVDGLTPAWPLFPEELDPWYDLVEARLGLSGAQEHSEWVPDSQLAHIRVPAPAEAALIAKIQAKYPLYNPIIGRFAPPMENLADAAATGNMLCRQGAIVRHVDTDQSKRVTGVTFHDCRANQLVTARAPLVFLCASTLETTRILLTSKSDDNPNGIGNSSDMLGRNLMDHVSIRIEGTGPDLGPPSAAPVANSNVYMPRFESRSTGVPGQERGFGVRAYVSPGLGASYFVAVSDAEMLPNPNNRATLSGKVDAFGLPTLRIECHHGPEELAIAEQQTAALYDLVNLAGVKLREPIDKPSMPGSAIHECGTARMGSDPASSVLDPFNECWDTKGLFVTDGSAFPAEGLVNPTLTILALTARACDYAVRPR